MWMLALVALASAQSSKTIRTYGIVKKTETVVKYHHGQEVARFVEEIEHYNAEGDWIEKFTYSSGGELKLHEKRVYDDGEVVDETKIDLNGSSMKAAEPPSFERIISTYDKDDLLNKKEVDREGNVIELKEYQYNKLGDLTEVTTKNAEGEVIESERTEYDNRGLKTKESKYDGSGNLTEEKIFVYE
jgi:hypothetical protein